MFNTFPCRGYHTKLRPIQLDRVPGEERAAASVVKLLVPDLGPEVEWLLRTVAGLGSPVVFSHNDINTGNILVRWDMVRDNLQSSANIVYLMAPASVETLRYDGYKMAFLRGIYLLQRRHEENDN